MEFHEILLGPINIWDRIISTIALIIVCHYSGTVHC